MRQLGDRFSWLRQGRLVLCALLVALVASAETAQGAGGESYDYDGLGRLVRVVSSAGVVTEYLYDAAGNITAVVRGGAASPPTLSSASPNSIRRGSQVRITLTGTNLLNAGVQAVDRSLTLSGVSRTSSSIAFNLSAASDSALGASAIRVSSASGSASIDINIRPTLPKVELSPLPIAVPPDGRSASVDLVLSNVDDEAHTIGLSTVRPDIATVTPAAVTIPAGSTRVSFLVAGRAGGNTELRLESTTLGNTAVPIFVLAAFEGINTARASVVGVTRTGAAPPSATANGTVSAALVGLVRANTAWLDTSPRFVSPGTSQTLQIVGIGLPSLLEIGVEPADGITVGAPSIAPDGRAASVTLTAASGIAQGARRLILRSGTSVLTPVVTGADVLSVVAPAPAITSVQPIFLTPGTTVASFEIRGSNLQDVTSVQIQGGGITVGSSPVVNAAGTLLQVGLQVSAVASPGERVVVAVAPAGTSSTVATSANTVTVVPDGTSFQPYPNIAAPLVGVVRNGAAGPPANATYSSEAPAVGVTIGPLAVDVSPSSVARTETANLRIRGQSLGSVTAVTITPSTGLTVGPPVISGDGREASVQVSAAADAPLGLRRVELLAGAVPLRIAGTGALTLLVTPLGPVVDSIEPIVAVPSGVPFQMVVRGRNFQGASTIRITPATGISIGTLTVNAAGTEARALVTVDAGAALGSRSVSIVTPAGESSTSPSPSNQLTLVGNSSTLSLPSFLVGVQVGNGAPVAPIDALIAASNVGVVRGSANPGVPPTSVSGLFSAPGVGLLRGPAVFRVEPSAWVPGQAGTLVVRGRSIPAGSTVQVLPTTEATLTGNATVDADGGAIRQPISINANTLLKGLVVNVLAPDGRPVPFASGVSDAQAIWLYAGVPDVISLEPILARQGETVELLIRGTNLNDVLQVTSEPATGLDFGTGFTINAAGTELRIQLSVRDDATTGPRVIRVFTRLGGSSATASPANTFTVFPRN